MTSESNALALFGGSPVRAEPYPPHTTIIDDAEKKAVAEVLDTGHLSGFSGVWGPRFLGGPKVREFEERFAGYLAAAHAVSFNSATSALHAAIAAAGIGPGDEVITTPYTMSATASAILMQNAIPVFADIEERTYGLDPDSVEACLTPRTKAILTVNLFGHPSRLDALSRIAERHGILLIEDNCQSLGARYKDGLAGDVGAMAIHSLNYHKTIQTGEGGVVVTNDEDLATRLQLTRNHGEVVVRDMGWTDIDNTLGYNYRLTEIQAAMGVPQLEKLDYFVDVRQTLAGRLTESLAGFDFLVPPVIEDDCSHAFYLYPLRYKAEGLGFSRHVFLKALAAEGINMNEGYVRPIYLEPLYQEKLVYGRRGCPFTCAFYEGEASFEKGRCPVTERMHFEELFVTNICRYPNGEREIQEFATAVEKIVANADKLRMLETA